MTSEIAAMPKVDLHCHLEGCIPPDLVISLAARNGLDIPYRTVHEVQAAQDYGEPALENFLIYFSNVISVLRTPQDFYDAVYTLLRRCNQENIRYIEFSIDPQVHMDRGLELLAITEAITRAREQSVTDFDVHSGLMLCFIRTRPAKEALEILELIAPHRERVVGIGLDNEDADDYPLTYKPVYQAARDCGLGLAAHCDVDADHAVRKIWRCLTELGIDRLDHGQNAVEDPALMAELKQRGTCITGCPTWRPSDQRPRRLRRIREMYDYGLNITLNSDDPEAMASGYLTKLMTATRDQSGYSAADMVVFTANAVEAAWAPAEVKQDLRARLEDHCRNQGIDRTATTRGVTST